MQRVSWSIRILLGLSVCVPLLVNAQAAVPTESFSLDVSPQYPTPYSTVTITPSSELIDMTASTVTVFLNGTQIGKGPATQSYQTQIGGPGSVNDITAIVDAPDGTFHQEVVLRPSEVSLIAEPDTTVHPLYAGAPLIGDQSKVRLVALADLEDSNGPIDPTTLNYAWKLNDQELDSESGPGQDVLMMTAPVSYRDAQVTVTVTDPNSTTVAQATIDLAAVNPVVRLYEDDPLSGPLYNNALGNTFGMSGTEDSFLAVPYFFSKAPSYAWTINGSPASASPILTVRGSGNGAGSANIAVTTNDSDTLQSGSANTTVSFSAGTPSSGGIGSFFGL